MRLLHLHWPHLPLALTKARASESFPTGPTILGGQPWTAGTVIDASPEARALGVRRGIPLGAAHRLAPEAVFLDPDPDADAAALEAAFERLAAFSPGIAGTIDPHDPAFGLFEVQVDGLGPLWGAEPVLVERIGGALERLLPGQPRAGIAGTRFAATVAAIHATPGAPILVPPGDDAAFLASYPAGLLTTEPDVRARLTRFGLRRIGAVAELARSALVARFGEEGEHLHARANGVETDPFRPRRASERLLLGLPIEPAVEELESLRFVLHRLAAALTEQLQARGLAAARGALRLELDLAFARPGTPRELAGAEPATGQQLPLFEPQAARNARLGWQLMRLALTFGEDRLRRAEITDPEAPLPERRWTWQSVTGEGGDR